MILHRYKPNNISTITVIRFTLYIMIIYRHAKIIVIGSTVMILGPMFTIFLFPSISTSRIYFVSPLLNNLERRKFIWLPRLTNNAEEFTTRRRENMFFFFLDSPKRIGRTNRGALPTTGFVGNQRKS